MNKEQNNQMIARYVSWFLNVKKNPCCDQCYRSMRKEIRPANGHFFIICKEYNHLYQADNDEPKFANRGCQHIMCSNCLEGNRKNEFFQKATCPTCASQRAREIEQDGDEEDEEYEQEEYNVGAIAVFYETEKVGHKFKFTYLNKSHLLKDKMDDVKRSIAGVWKSMSKEEQEKQKQTQNNIKKRELGLDEQGPNKQIKIDLS